jgi:hypothetical protein
MRISTILFVLCVFSVNMLFSQGYAPGGGRINDPARVAEFDHGISWPVKGEWRSKGGGAFSGELKEINKSTVVIVGDNDQTQFEIRRDELVERDQEYIERVQKSLVLEKIKFQKSSWIDPVESEATFFAFVFLNHIDQKDWEGAKQMIGLSSGGNPLVTMTAIEKSRRDIYGFPSSRIRVSSSISQPNNSFVYRIGFQAKIEGKNLNETVTVKLKDNAFSVEGYN